MKKQVLLFVLLVLVLTGCADRGPEPMIPEGNDAKEIYQDPLSDTPEGCPYGKTAHFFPFM